MNKDTVVQNLHFAFDNYECQSQQYNIHMNLKL